MDSILTFCANNTVVFLKTSSENMNTLSQLSTKVSLEEWDWVRPDNILYVGYKTTPLSDELKAWLEFCEWERVEDIISPAKPAITLYGWKIWPSSAEVVDVNYRPTKTSRVQLLNTKQGTCGIYTIIN